MGFLKNLFSHASFYERTNHCSSSWESSNIYMLTLAKNDGTLCWYSLSLRLMHMSGGWLLRSCLFFTVYTSIIQAMYFKTCITFWHMPPANTAFCYWNRGRKISQHKKKYPRISSFIESYHCFLTGNREWSKMYLWCSVIWDGFVSSASPSTSKYVSLPNHSICLVLS